MLSSWNTQLNRELKSLVRKNDQGGGLPRIAFVGIGNEFKADDLAGLLVIRHLAESIGSNERILILDAGAAPENCTGALRRFEPDIVVLIDAVEMEKEAGAAAWIAIDELDGSSAFTHAPSPSALGQFLRAELRCRVVLIGIQPGSLEFDRPASQVVCRAAHRVAAGIREVLEEVGY